MALLKNRYEILFLYEARDCNPNGDPLDENRPRTDAETGEATVTDVRIKRTVRDYFLAVEPDVDKRMQSGTEILVRDTFKSDGHLSEGKDRAEQFIDSAASDKKKDLERRDAVRDAVLKHCIDARLFGAALPLGKGKPSIQLTGPVQFSAFNRSLHRVAPCLVQQTAAYAGNAGASQKSFAERWLLPYALVAGYAVVNEMAACTTNMTTDDLDAFLKALWWGTSNLNTHSKMGHDPLLLAVLEYEPGYRIGMLSRRVRMVDKKAEDTALRSTDDYTLQTSPLLDAVQGFDKVRQLKIKQDPRLQCKDGDLAADFLTLAKNRQIASVPLEL